MVNSKHLDILNVYAFQIGHVLHGELFENNSLEKVRKISRWKENEVK